MLHASGLNLKRESILTLNLTLCAGSTFLKEKSFVSIPGYNNDCSEGSWQDHYYWPKSFAVHAVSPFPNGGGCGSHCF